MSAGARLAARLARSLRQREPARLEIPGFRPAAVLVPILDAPSGPELLFTVRAGELAHHAGQIAFPGGRMEPGETPAEAALRETREEIGLRVPPEAIVGRLDDHPSPARFVAVPLVAVVPWPQPLQPNPREVAEIFSAPIDELRAISPRWEERVLRDFRRRIHFYDWGERLIWGFTGNIVKELLELLPEGDAGEPPARDSLDG